MTKQYLLGEMSLLVAELQDVAVNAGSVRALGELRREAETGPLSGLTSVATRALVVADGLCWDSLSQGNTAGFIRQCTAASGLREFCVCAGLLADA